MGDPSQEHTDAVSQIVDELQTRAMGTFSRSALTRLSRASLPRFAALPTLTSTLTLTLA